MLITDFTFNCHQPSRDGRRSPAGCRTRICLVPHSSVASSARRAFNCLVSSPVAGPYRLLSRDETNIEMTQIRSPSDQSLTGQIQNQQTNTAFWQIIIVDVMLTLFNEIIYISLDYYFRQTDGWTDRKRDGLTDRWTVEYRDGRADRKTDGRRTD